VFHLHVHVIPRNHGDDVPAQIAARIAMSGEVIFIFYPPPPCRPFVLYGESLMQYTRRRGGGGGIEMTAPPTRGQARKALTAAESTDIQASRGS
jgi:hypothetical protein